MEKVETNAGRTQDVQMNGRGAYNRLSNRVNVPGIRTTWGWVDILISPLLLCDFYHISERDLTPRAISNLRVASAIWTKVGDQMPGLDGRQTVNRIQSTLVSGSGDCDGSANVMPVSLKVTVGRADERVKVSMLGRSSLHVTRTCNG